MASYREVHREKPAQVAIHTCDEHLHDLLSDKARSLLNSRGDVLLNDSGKLSPHHFDIVVLFHILSHRFGYFVSKAPILRHADHRVSQFLSVPGWNEKAMLLVSEYSGDAPDRGSDDWQTRAHGLDNGIGETFSI